jgi:hypothetical protein
MLGRMNVDGRGRRSFLVDVLSGVAGLWVAATTTGTVARL